MADDRPTLAEEFNALFAGLERAHGEYSVPEGAVPDEKGKLTGKALTYATPITVQLWERHLTGANSFGLGIVPIRDDATCVFGAIDVDVYPLDIEKLNAEVRRRGLPLLLCRTKSGGAHLYVFGSGPLPAPAVRAKLMEWATVLGYPSVEIFPKQGKLASENDYGSWINVPYQAGAKTTRYALDAEGKALRAAAFVDAARAIAVTAAELAAFEMAPDEEMGDAWEQSPPCLEALARRGFPQGTRNNALFNVGVYLAKRFEDGWEQHLRSYNERFMRPPLSPSDVTQIERSLKKKKYGYKCKDQPICAACNKEVCATRDFGVGAGNRDTGLIFGGMLKVDTDPPLYILTVNGKNVELEVDHLTEQRIFRKVIMAKLDIWSAIVTPKTWDLLMRDLLSTMQTQAVPVDAKKDGQLLGHLAEYCTGKWQARRREEIGMGRPWTDATAGVTYFQSREFMRYLNNHRITGYGERELYRLLRNEGVEDDEIDVNGKPVRVWSVKSFARQTSPYAVPKTEQEEM